MNSKYFFCDGYPKPEGCGKIDYIIFDGYSFGDTQLEDIEFQAFIDGDNKLKVGTMEDWGNNPYLNRLNKKVILKEALEYIEECDVATCPLCRNDVAAQPNEEIQ